MGNIDSAAMGNPNSTDRWEIWKSAQGLACACYLAKREGASSSPLRKLKDGLKSGLPLTPTQPQNLKCEKASKTT